MKTPNVTLVHYNIDARASKFTVQAFASGMLSAMGHNPKIGIRTFSGGVDFSPEAPAGGGLRLSIQAASLSVLDDISDKDRREIERMMNEQVLEVAKYPEILYDDSVVSIVRVETSLYSASLNGNLTFRGITHSQPVTARVAEFGEMLRVSGEFAMRQTDYGVKPISVAGGALKVKDEIKFSFEIVARKQE
jgi:polyisoprenoid-binding protein YceI